MQGTGHENIGARLAGEADGLGNLDTDVCHQKVMVGQIRMEQIEGTGDAQNHIQKPDTQFSGRHN